MSSTVDPNAISRSSGRPDERRAMAVACGAHVLHDGYTDIVYVMLPV